MPDSDSVRSLLASLSEEQTTALLRALSPQEAETLAYDWAALLARPSQLAPSGTWRTWLILAGRGWGKTRTGAEWIRAQVESGAARRIGLVARTAADARDVMVEGVSGVLAASPPWFRPVYEPSKRRLTWPNGAVATVFSADKPDLLRGPQLDAAWCDELAAWRYPDAWRMLGLALRLGADPRVVVTTTPRPTPLIRELVASPTVTIVRGTTYENRAHLAPQFIDQVLAAYEGTRLGRQELYAEILDDTLGALWTRDLLERQRMRVAPPLRRTVVAIDPAVSTREGSAETGIVVAGVGVCACKGSGKPEEHAFVLDDLSGQLAPLAWATRAVDAYRDRRADRIIGEANNGGDLVEAILRTVDGRAPFRAVVASVGKRTRAEPVAGLYEQGRVHHVGLFPQLEDQICTWAALTRGERSPDRLDALVWALAELMLGAGAPSFEGLPHGRATMGPRRR